MSTKTNQVIFELKAIDDLTPAATRAQASLDRLSKAGAKSDPLGLKPQTAGRDPFESDVRKVIADRYRAMRNATRDEQVKSAAEDILFGGPSKEVAATAGAEAGHAMAEGTHKGFLNGLKANFGKHSPFADITHLLKGGGAIFGLSLATSELAALTGEVVKLKDELNEGKISSGELADQLARAVPILGHLYAAGRNIHELWTGDEAVARMITEEASHTNKLIDARTEAMIAQVKAAADLARFSESIRGDIELIGASPETAQRLILEKSIKTTMEEEAKLFEAMTKASEATRFARKEQADDRVKAARAEIERIDNLSTTPMADRGKAVNADQIAARTALDQAIAKQKEIEDDTRHDTETKIQSIEALGDIAEKSDKQGFENRAELFRKQTTDRIAQEKEIYDKAQDYIAKGFATTLEQWKEIDKSLDDFFGGVEGATEKKAKSASDNFRAAPNANSHFITGASAPDQAAKRVEQKLDAQTQLLKDANQLAKDTLNWFKSRKTDAAVAITPFLIS